MGLLRPGQTKRRKQEPPASKFLKVKVGDYVVVAENYPTDSKCNSREWIGQIIHIAGGAREPQENSLFQIIDIDSGLIQIINADLVIDVIKPRDY